MRSKNALLLMSGGLLFAALALNTFAADAPKPQPVTSAPASEFPLRPQYIDVPVIETAEFDKKFDDVFIVDVRSPYEYQTLRIKDAILIPVTDKNFADQVRQLREKSANKPIVFYCNGKTCRKSYDAVLKAKAARITDTWCYDAGAADWARAHPEKAVLLGNSPVNPEKVITDAKFKAHLLDQATSTKASELLQKGVSPIIVIVDPKLRRPLAEIYERFNLDIIVLSHAEIDSSAKFEVLGSITLDK